MQSYLLDIDELVLLCRDAEARRYIAEAVACYKNGAFRACIVMTWIATLYDFLYKLRELTFSGDKQAAAKLQDFESARTSGDYFQALKFEESILESARNEFEFINQVEYEELKRLREDRNRCAHPSMISEDEIYEPSAEQARYHLRNSVLYMLQYPPTQGKSFVDSLKSDVTSIGFPEDVEQAAKYLTSKRVERAKAVVIRNLSTAILKGLLNGDLDDTQSKRAAAALNALRKIRRPEAEDILANKLPKVVDDLSDEQLHTFFRFVQYVPDVYQYLPDHTRIRIENFVPGKNPEQWVDILDVELSIPEFKATADKLYEKIPDNFKAFILAKLTEKHIRPDFVETALVQYEGALNFATANTLSSSVLIPMLDANYIDDVGTERILAACENNSQVYDSLTFPAVLRAISNSTKLSPEELRALLGRFPRTNSRYASVIFPQEEA